AGSGAAGAVVGLPAGETSTAELRRRIGLLVDLMSQRELFLLDLAKATARATEVAAVALEVARVSIWRLEAVDPRVSAIRCVDLFERATGSHSAGGGAGAGSLPS